MEEAKSWKYTEMIMKAGDNTKCELRLWGEDDLPVKDEY